MRRSINERSDDRFDGSVEGSKPVRAERGIESCAYASFPSCDLSKTIPDAGVRGSAATTRTEGDMRRDSGGCGLGSTTVTLFPWVSRTNLHATFAHRSGASSTFETKAAVPQRACPSEALASTCSEVAVPLTFCATRSSRATTGTPVRGVGERLIGGCFPTNRGPSSMPVGGVGAAVRSVWGCTSVRSCFVCAAVRTGFVDGAFVDGAFVDGASISATRAADAAYARSAGQSKFPAAGVSDDIAASAPPSTNSPLTRSGSAASSCRDELASSSSADDEGVHARSRCGGTSQKKRIESA